MSKKKASKIEQVLLLRETAGILLVVHRIQCGVSLTVAGETNKAKAAAAVGITVLDDNLDMGDQLSTKHNQSCVRRLDRSMDGLNRIIKRVLI